MSTPTVSILLSNYNHGRFLPEAMDAILRQSHAPLEIIVIDDASTDDSKVILERYQAEYPGLVRVIFNAQNKGLMANQGHLLALARGSHVYFPASDDRVLPGFLARSLQLLSLYPDSGVCSTLTSIVNESGHDRGIVRMPIVLNEEGYLSPAMVLSTLTQQGNWFMGNTTIYRRDALVEIGGFDPALGPYGDFTTHILALRYGACYIPEALAQWRQMEQSYSRSFTANLQANVAMLRTAENLMRQKYPALFPETYIRSWKRELFVGVATSYVRSTDDRRFAGLEDLLPETTALDEGFLKLLRAFPAVGRRLVKVYLNLRFRREKIGQILSRRLQYLVRSSTV